MEAMDSYAELDGSGGGAYGGTNEQHLQTKMKEIERREAEAQALEKELDDLEQVIISRFNF